MVNLGKNGQPRALPSWLFLGTLFALCGILGVLQYRWIGEVSRAERERLRESLQANLNRLGQRFNMETADACREADVAARYQKSGMFRRVALVAPGESVLTLRMLDPRTGRFSTADWPESWNPFKNRIESWREHRPPGPRHEREEEGLIIETPLFGRGRPEGPPAWLLCELNQQYVRDTMIPELLQRYLADGGPLNYQSVVLTRTDPPSVIYASEPNRAEEIARNADAGVSLFEGRRPPLPGPMPPGFGRWRMLVRHRAGSLEAVVARTRHKNLAVIAGVLLLMMASGAALIRLTRRAQRLAELQMEFVAGVSHELRTPLTVINTAAYNLRGKLAGNPAQVERYGALIQQESGRLRELVEQVLRFAGAGSGRVVQTTEPVSVTTVIDETLESSKSMLQGSQCVVEKTVAPGLPLVLADPVALKHALQNLLNNAAKYGTERDKWIGLSAGAAGDSAHPMVEIRVADHGPGIPQDEQEHIFDAFFRGRRALQDQIHGTGLGLCLVKKIVEAHGGAVAFKSEPLGGAEFTIRLPAAPARL